MKVSFELSPNDILYFRERLKRVAAEKDDHEEEPILEGAERLLEEAEAAEPPEFVRERLAKLAELIAMLRDEEWKLEGRDRVRILDALAYFVDPEDLIPDRVPGIGYLDDAIMVELIVQELRHEIKAYEDFCSFRSRPQEARDEEKIAARRKALHARMRRQRRREIEQLRARSSGRRFPLLRLW